MDLYQFSNIGSSGVAESHGSVGPLEEVRNGFANNVTAAKDNRAFARNINPGFFKQNHDTFWCAGNKVWFARSLCKLTDIESVETIDILERRDG